MRPIPLHEILAALALAWILPTAISSGQAVEDIKGTIETDHGRVYQNVEVLHRDPHGITFRHSKGIAKIPFSELSSEIRGRYQYDKDDALKFLNEHASAGEDTDGLKVGKARRIRFVALQFLPETYTNFLKGTPITVAGPSIGGALRASRFSPPSWVYPTPVNAPIDMYLWRQLSAQHHLNCATSHAHRRLGGYGDVSRVYPQSSSYPRLAYDSVPAIRMGRGGAAFYRD